MLFSINRYNPGMQRAENQIDNVISKNVQNGQVNQTEGTKLSNSIMEYLVDPNAEQGNPFAKADANIDNMIQSAVQASSDTRERMGAKPSMGLESPDMSQTQNDLSVAENTENEISQGVSEQEGVCNNAQQDVDNQQSVTDNAQGAVNTSQSNVNNSQATVDSDQSAVDTASGEVNTATTNVQTAQTDASEAATELSDAQSELENAQSEASSVQSSTSSEATSESGTTSDDSTNSGSSSSATSSQTAEAQQVAQEKIEQAQQRVEEAQQAKEEADEQVETEQNNLTEAQDTLTDAQGTLETSQVALQENQAELQTNQESLSTAQDNLQTCQNALETENSTLSTQQAELDTATEEVTNAEQQVDEAEEVAQENAEDGTQAVAGQELAQNLWKDIHGIGTKDTFQEHINSITPDNVADTVSEYQKLSDANSTKDKESLVEAICDEAGMSWGDRLNSVKHITSCLDKKAESLGMETDVLQSDTRATVTEAFTTLPASTVGYINTDKIDEQVNEYVDLIDRGTKMNAAIDARVNETSTTHLENEPGTDFFGNGKVDYDATQLTGNCWAHAAVNSYTSSDRGQERINNHVVTRDGITAVYLGEADNNNNGENGNGIYTYNQRNLLDGADYADTLHRQSYGDGDVTAIMMATEQYRSESGYDNKGNSLMDGGIECEMYNTLEGYKTADGSKAQVFLGDDEIPKGSGACLATSTTYTKIQDMITNGEGCATVSFKTTPETSTEDITTRRLKDSNAIMSGHAYSIVRMDNNNVYLEESNHPNNQITLNKDKFIDLASLIQTNKF